MPDYFAGYSVRHLRHVAEHCHKDVDVIMSYFRHNLFDQSLQRDLAFYKAKDIGVINASPLGKSSIIHTNTPLFAVTHHVFKNRLTAQNLFLQGLEPYCCSAWNHKRGYLESRNPLC